MSKQEIMEVIVGCADKLEHVPSFVEVVKMTQISRRQIRKHFGSYTRALRECNLQRKETGGGGQKLPLEKLFADWAGVVQRLKKLPSMGEYEMLSKYTTGPLVRWFGSWRQVPHGLKQFAESRGLAEEWKNELELVTMAGAARGTNAGTRMALAPVPADWPLALFNRPAYGPPMWPGPLAYGPVNEMGVVFLFGWMAPQLGYVVHRLQPEFPDCEAMRRVGEDRCQLVKAEFEYESRNFLKHMHDASGCDLIICWRHNWPECPLEVVELRSLLPKLP
ncbi:MAG: homing endonuclease associated repeat-containing protein [Candidatus Angelobacter sp.]